MPYMAPFQSFFHIYIFPPLSHFLSFATLFLCCLLSEISTSLPVFSTPTYKAHKATAQEYKYTLMQTRTHIHTLMKCPISSHSFILLAFTHSHHHHPFSLSFPLWLSVRMDASAGDSWNLIHAGMERGRQGERE